MNSRIIFPVCRQTRYSPAQNQWTAWQGLLKIAGALSLLLFVSGCMPLLSSMDKESLISGDKAVVLMRIKCTLDDQPFEPCIFRREEPCLSDRFFVGFAMGSFETFGRPGFVSARFLSDKSLDEGWISFLITPGIYYLYVRGPDSSQTSHLASRDYYQRCFREIPCWRIDVPEHSKFIYAGTLNLAGKVTGALLFGDKIIAPVASQPFSLNDEHELAEKLFSQSFPGANTVKTILMQRRSPDAPFIFRSPLFPASQ
jgi:hypothetical protein